MKLKKHQVLIEPETFLPFWLWGWAIIAIIIHNAIYGLFQIEEAVFFISSLLLILGFFGSVVYAIITYINKGKPKDIWKLGFLGIFGVLSLFAPPMLAFYGFFVFFGLKNK